MAVFRNRNMQNVQYTLCFANVWATQTALTAVEESLCHSPLPTRCFITLGHQISCLWDGLMLINNYVKRKFHLFISWWEFSAKSNHNWCTIDLENGILFYAIKVYILLSSLELSICPMSSTSAQYQCAPLALLLFQGHTLRLKYYSNGFSVTLDQVRALAKRAISCSYYIKTECVKVQFHKHCYWRAYNGDKVMWQNTAGTFCEYTSKSPDQRITYFLTFRQWISYISTRILKHQNRTRL